MRRILLPALLLALTPFLTASTTVLTPWPKAHFVDNNNVLCVGCQLFTYQAGTTTKLATWTDQGGGTNNTDPVILNARGEANVWLTPGTAYKFVLAPANDTDPPTNAFWTVDQIAASAPYNPASVAITGGTISGVTISGATINTSTLNSPTIVTPAITGGTITGSSIAGANVCSNHSQVKSANYSPLQADQGNLIELSGNSTFTLNFSNSYTAGFIVCVANLDSNNAKHIQLPSGTTWLWPKQFAVVWLDNTGTLERGQPERYVAPSLTVYADASSGNDANDCLTASKACQHIQHAIIMLRTYVDTQDSVPTIQLADGTYTEAIDTSATPTGGADQILINGNAVSPGMTQLLAPAASVAVTVRDYGIFTLQNMEIGCGSGTGAVNASQFGVVDLRIVIVGSCDGQNALTAQDEGHMNIEPGLTVAGNSSALLYSHGTGAQITAGGGQTITCSGALTIGNFLLMDNGAGMTTEGTTLAFSGCGSVTGTKYTVTTNAVADTGGSTLPGNVAGSTSTGGIYN